jgi:UDPglucose--hexose-1-phosphate uridylyltransferase
MRKTSARLADGRELIYFDSGQDERQAPPDSRRLPPRPGGGEVRYDPTLGEWVTMAAHRQDRTHLPPTDSCPLCPSGAGRQTEVPDEDYEVAVFENRFPSFAGAPASTGNAAAVGGDLLGRRPALGRCEVVCFTPDHNGAFSQLEPGRARMIVDVWADRTAALSSLPGIEQVFCFENRGEEFGVTLQHPHGQIYGYPFTTPTTARMVARAAEHRDQGGELFGDLLAAERANGERIVTSGQHWTALVPHAARWPFELHLYPHRQVPDLVALTDEERDELAPLYLDVLRRLESVCGGGVPYIAAWHQAPLGPARELVRLHLRLFSNRRAPEKLKHLAGSEAAMGAFVNDLRPESVAKLLRDASPL